MSNPNYMKPCPYCGSNAVTHVGDRLTDIDCPTCGNYKHQFYGLGESKNEIASFLYYKKAIEGKEKRYIISNSKIDGLAPGIAVVSTDEIMAFYPQCFSERIDAILLGFAKCSRYLGELLTLTREELISSLFVKRYDDEGIAFSTEKVNAQLELITDYLNEKKYLEFGGDYYNKFIILLPAGWKRVDELQQQKSDNSKNVFIAMSFDESMEFARDAIKSAVLESGYVPRLMDEIEHNHQIVPEMLYEIRNAKFVIAELTGHNNGAYFEAGYALGFGKEVIQICKKDNFGIDGHFDVKQINTILWENTNDLKERLVARIRATVN